MSEGSDYIVIDGVWYDRTRFRRRPTDVPSGTVELRLVPSGRFEQREDGAVAEIYEAHPDPDCRMRP